MIELLIGVGLAVLVFFIVGAVMLHILVGLVLLPFKLALLAFQGVVFTLFAFPLALVALAVFLAVVIGTLAVVGATLCALVF